MVHGTIRNGFCYKAESLSDLFSLIVVPNDADCAALSRWEIRNQCLYAAPNPEVLQVESSTSGCIDVTVGTQGELADLQKRREE